MNSTTGIDDFRGHPQICDNVDLTVDEDKKVANNEQDDPFGGEEYGEVQYRTMKWWHCAILMVAQAISLGVLSLPSSMAAFGFGPGCALLLAIGALTTYTGVVLGQFKLHQPQVHNMADAAEVLFGAAGRELVNVIQIVFFIFLMGSHVLTFAIMMNTLTDHAACTIVFCVSGAVLCFVLSLSRKMQEVSYLGFCSFLSIFSAIIITMITVGIRSNNPTLSAAKSPDLISGTSATLNMIIAFSGHLSFFSFQSELSNPSDFPKALYASQATNTAIYILTAVVIYRYTGDSVPSPALLSAGPVVSKIAFGIAIGTIVIAGVIIAHVGAKCVYVRIFRGTGRMNEKSLVSYGSWLLIILGMWVLAWIVAEVVTVFNDLLNLLAAAFCSWFSFGLEGLFWFEMNMNRGRLVQGKKMVVGLAVLNAGIVLLCCVVCGMGLWATGTNIRVSVQTAHGVFSCADNR